MSGAAMRVLHREKVGDMLVVIVIAAVSLIVAYVTFGVLNSNAEGAFEAYSVGGALAGFLVSGSFLWSIYRSLRHSSAELEKLRSQKLELERQLIRGAPRPLGFTIEVDEKERIVIAHPEHWTRAGGTLFDFVESYDEASLAGALPEDDFPATFRVKFAPMRCAPDFQPDLYYEQVIAWAQEAAAKGCMTPPTFEYVFVGEPPHGVRSLKVAYTQYVYSVWDRDPIVRQIGHSFQPLMESDYRNLQASKTKRANVVAHVGSAAEANVATGSSERQRDASGLSHLHSTNGGESSGPREALVQTFNIDVVCFHPVLKRIFWFQFIDDMSDFAKASTDFSHLLNSTRFLL